MAPPRYRRPGFSRRAQYGLFAGYVVAVAGIILGLALILVARLDPAGFALLRGAARDLLAPVSAAGRGAARRIASADDAARAYIDAGGQNRALRAELAASRAALIRARTLAEENRRLRLLVRLAENTPETVVATRIISSSAMSIRRLATIDAGASSGVAPGQPVRSAEGLIGRVLDVGRISARVVLLTDGGSTVPVRLARGGAPALAVGGGTRALDLRALAAGATPFRRGDVVVTSGTGGVYPPGIPVAVVTAVSGDRAAAWPIADPTRIEFALVLRPSAEAGP